MRKPEPESVPVSIPLVVLDVHENGTVTATVDGKPLNPDPFAPPWQGQAYQRAHGHAELRVVPAAHAGALYGAEAIAEVTAWSSRLPVPYSGV